MNVATNTLKKLSTIVGVTIAVADGNSSQSYNARALSVRYTLRTCDYSIIE